MPASTASIWSRKRDLLYLVFFFIHIPIIFSVDLAPFYPESIKPRYTAAIQEFYKANYKDKFFINPPSWFKAYVIMEILYHVPLSIWAVKGLLQESPSVPLQLLIWAVQTSITTLTCLVEVWDWDHVTQQEKFTLSQLYAPYLAFAVGMGLDMFLRLRASLATGGTERAPKRVAAHVENPKDK